MAEAGGQPADSVQKAYFCYSCNREITSIRPDFSCSTCGSGFIEEIPGNPTQPQLPQAPFFFGGPGTGGNSQGGGGNNFGFSISSGGVNPLFRSNSQPPGQDQPMSMDLFDIISSALGGSLRRAGTPAEGTAPTATTPTTATMPTSESATEATTSTEGQRRPRGHISFVIDNRPRTGGAEGTATVTVGVTPGGNGNQTGNAGNGMENLLETFFSQLIAGLNGTPGGGGPNVNITGFPLAGNLGDYVWGRDGLDAIVTQIMNEMQGTGPPPMSAEKVEGIPDIQVTQDLVDRKLQCSVCWDDFVLDEKVKKLDCEHLFHPDCIIPWLKLHGTCPICRRDFTEGEQQQSQANSNTTGADSVTPLNPTEGTSSSNNTSQSQRTAPTATSPLTFIASLASSLAGNSPNNSFSFVVGGNSTTTAPTSGSSTTTSTNTSSNSGNGSSTSNPRGGTSGGQLDNMEFDFD